jgi:leucyl aminopeptidase
LHDYSPLNHWKDVMPVTTSISTRTSAKADAIVVFVSQTPASFKAQTKVLASAIPHIQPLLDTQDFVGKKGTTALVYPGSAAAAKRLILVGLGEDSAVTTEGIRKAAAAATKRAAAATCASICFELPTVAAIADADVAQAIAEAASLCLYKFDKYKTTSKEQSPLSKISIAVSKEQQKAAATGVAIANSIVEGVILARDLANAPNNEIYPETLAKRAIDAGKTYGFKTTVLDKKKILALKMGGLLGVNQGSVRPPVFIVMEYMAGPKTQKPIVLVGKGITFDTGGISIKPAAGMSDMKMDMHGAASVIGTMASIAALKLKRNVVALVPSTENMPSGTAYVPGDILTFMNGKTAEIDNTDAEGRLVLADALCYAERYKPEVCIDLATLTGACVIALGTITTGMLGTSEETKAGLKAAAARTNEYVCELPLYDEYEELISSDYADIKNSGGRGAGTITAALFLKHFVSYPWVHLDIAGTGIAPKPGAYTPKGGTGVGVRLLIDWLRNL